MSDNPATLLKIQSEVSLIRSFIIGLAGKDREGRYRPEFVKKILSALKEKPTYDFDRADSFLAHLAAHD